MARAARPAAGVGGGNRGGSLAIRAPSPAPAAPPGLELPGARCDRLARQGEARATSHRPSRPQSLATPRSAGPGSVSPPRRAGPSGGQMAAGEPRAAVPGGGREEGARGKGGRRRPSRLGKWAGLGARRGGGALLGPGPRATLCLRFFALMFMFTLPTPPPFLCICLLIFWLERSGKRGPRGEHEVCAARVISACTGGSGAPLLMSFTQSPSVMCLA